MTRGAADGREGYLLLLRPAFLKCEHSAVSQHLCELLVLNVARAVRVQLVEDLSAQRAWREEELICSFGKIEPYRVEHRVPLLP